MNLPATRAIEIAESDGWESWSDLAWDEEQRDIDDKTWTDVS
jgi:hypothetical protein